MQTGIAGGLFIIIMLILHWDMRRDIRNNNDVMDEREKVIRSRSRV